MCGHIAIRTCIACGRKAPKDDLLRLVRTRAGGVEPDVKADKPGRGAYLCYNQACFTQALKRHAIQRHLGVNPPHNLLEELKNVKN